MTDEKKPDILGSPDTETPKPAEEVKKAGKENPQPTKEAQKPSKEAPKPTAAAPPKPKPKPQPPPEPPKGPEDQAPPEDMALPATVTALQAAVPGSVDHVSFWVGDWTVIVGAEHLLAVMRFLKEDESTALDYCSDITATDWPPREKRFDVIYCLYSTKHRHRLRVKVRAGEGDEIESVCDVWSGANWLEREVFDQFGVNIVNHPDMRRILMPDEWQGYPQRKDYPLEGPGELLMENPQDWLRLRNIPDESMVDGEIE